MFAIQIRVQISHMVKKGHVTYNIKYDGSNLAAPSNRGLGGISRGECRTNNIFRIKRNRKFYLFVLTFLQMVRSNLPHKEQ